MNYVTVATLLAVIIFTAAVFVIRQHGYVATIYYLAGVLYDHASKVKGRWNTSEAAKREQWKSRLQPKPYIVRDDKEQEEFERNAVNRYSENLDLSKAGLQSVLHNRLVRIPE